MEFVLLLLYDFTWAALKIFEILIFSLSADLIRLCDACCRRSMLFLFHPTIWRVSDITNQWFWFDCAGFVAQWIWLKKNSSTITFISLKFYIFPSSSCFRYQNFTSLRVYLWTTILVVWSEDSVEYERDKRGPLCNGLHRFDESERYKASQSQEIE